MRSRYTAYVLRDEQYLMDTWHGSTRPGKIDFSGVDSVLWTGLEIVNTGQGQPDDNDGSVEFVAGYKVDGKDKQLHENSRFVKEQGQWFYLDGKIKRNLSNNLGASAHKPGRNQPCPCGSGKKYKHCCIHH